MVVVFTSSPPSTSFRFLLGMGEGGGFPGSGKAVAEWFPPGERSLAFGIFNTGSAVGAVLAPHSSRSLSPRWAGALGSLSPAASGLSGPSSG
ncbi:MAG: MFS transporter [Pedosphaera sp.]|nr:MFS transporter [Pedosphaera sp.]